MTTNILDYLDSAAEWWPDKTAIADDKNTLTYSQWLDYAERIGTVISRETGGALRKPVLVFVDRRIEGPSTAGCRTSV